MKREFNEEQGRVLFKCLVELYKEGILAGKHSTIKVNLSDPAYPSAEVIIEES